MKVTLSTDPPLKVTTDLLAVGVADGQQGRDPLVKAIDKASQGSLKKQIRLEKFEGKDGQVLKATPGGVKAKQVLLVGLGDQSSTVAAARTLAVRAASVSQSYGTIAIAPPSEAPDVVRGVVSGAFLGAYRFTRYLTGDRVPSKSLSTVKLLVDKRTPELREAVQAGVALGESVNHARDLTNAPPNDMNPPALADFAKAQAKDLGIQCKVWDKKGVQKLGMNLLLAVNRGSAVEPRFIHMTYKPKGVKDAPKVAFVGKGITFDAGGLCLKPPKSMLDMKCDMSGAAVTIGVVLAAARLGLPVEVHGLVGSTENMTGDEAYRPGDVFTSLDGKTVEIINTDAEGRLVLADALAYGRELGLDCMVDHATLTGACMVALGPWTAGLFTDDEELAERYATAGAVEGESYWRLPLEKALREMLESEVADLKHTGERHGGSITAALFLREFVGDTPWIHLDIAGPAFQDRPHGYSGKGGTGFGVMTGVRFLESLVAVDEEE
ncbi:MAG TPA: leucyl aminopeptidase [Sandaracinaceae bacterium LLY-WYZ-13_1]|nr:leucyl aminopeptidase [Sandaracinaceae bacterium LLY-WYZ-13_1]